MGKRLRNLKAGYKGIRLKDNKFIAALGRLNETTTNTLQNYYGMEIHQNCELYAMKKSPRSTHSPTTHLASVKNHYVIPNQLSGILRRCSHPNLGYFHF